MLHVFAKNPRLIYSLLGQVLRGVTGVLQLVVIAKLPDQQSVANWYVIQGLIGWLLIFDVGLSGFLGAELARSRGRDLLSIRSNIHTFLIAQFSITLILGSLFIYFSGHRFEFMTGYVGIILIAGGLANLASVSIQAILQGEGYISESLKLSCLPQCVTLIGVVVAFCLKTGYFFLLVLWTSSNLIWLGSLYYFWFRNIPPQKIVTLDFGGLISFFSAKRSKVVSFAVGSVGFVITSRFTYLFLSAAFNTTDFARLSFTGNALQSIVSLLSFPMNGLVYGTLRKHIDSPGSGAWRKLIRNAFFTFLGINVFFFLFVILQSSNWSRMFQVFDKIIESPYLVFLFGVAISVEGFASWLRPLGQSVGRLAGVLVFGIFSLSCGGLSCLHMSIGIYIFLRLFFALLCLFVEANIGRKVLNV